MHYRSARIGYSIQVLAGRQAELQLDLMEQLMSVSIEVFQAIAGYLDETSKAPFVNPRHRPRAATFQPAGS
jgi:hypothetical protein